jgi:hypothetical protein
VSLKDVSFVVRRAWIDEYGMLMVCIEPLSNEAGKHLVKLLELEVVRLAPVGMGTLDGDKVTDDYELIGFSVENKYPPAEPRGKDLVTITPLSAEEVLAKNEGKYVLGRASKNETPQ